MKRRKGGSSRNGLKSEGPRTGQRRIVNNSRVYVPTNQEEKGFYDFQVHLDGFGSNPNGSRSDWEYQLVYMEFKFLV